MRSIALVDGDGIYDMGSFSRTLPYFVSVQFVFNSCSIEFSCHPSA